MSDFNSKADRIYHDAHRQIVEQRIIYLEDDTRDLHREAVQHWGDCLSALEDLEATKLPYIKHLEQYLKDSSLWNDFLNITEGE